MPLRLASTVPGPEDPLTVPAETEGVRLQDFLETEWPDVDRAFLRRLVADGGVRVNYQESDLRQKLHEGDVVWFELPDGVDELPVHRARRRDASEPVPRVLAENDWCVVVDKPARLPTLPDRAGRSQGVYGQLTELRPADDLRVAHRLDRDTSGCLVLARSLEAARWLDEQFRGGTVQKTYVALVEGVVGRERFAVQRALGPDRRRPGKVRVAAPDSRGARDAHTDVEVAERFRGHTLLTVHPRTGRGHQIRVHLQSVGHPIVADVDYGATGPLLLSAIKPGYKARRGTAETPLLERMFLHAARIEVPMPDGSVFAVDAPLPDELARALGKLRRFAARSGN